MRILGFTQIGRVFGAFQDCMEGFEELGHKTKIYGFPSSDSSVSAPLGDLVSEIRSFSPDFVFVVNHMYLPSGLLGRLRIPYASFFMDSPFYRVRREDLRGSLETPGVIFTWDKSYIPDLKRFGFRNVYHLLLATNPKIFMKMELSEEDMKRFGCNVSFAGRSGHLHYKKFCELTQNPCLKKICEEVVHRMYTDPTLPLPRVLKEIESSFGQGIHCSTEEDERLLHITLEYAAMSLWRKEIIESVSEFGCSICGDEPWREMVGDRVRFLGWIDREGLAKLYNATRINLNITMPQLRTTLPFRIFDVTACGGFLLTDIREDLWSCFEVGDEVVIYRDKMELKEKIRYYLEHPEERREIGEKGMNRTLKDHTYKKRMEEVVEVMGSIYG